MAYGLFGGSVIRHVLASQSYYRLTIVCSHVNDACIQSCQLTAEERNDELDRLLSGQTLAECGAVRATTAGAKARSDLWIAPPLASQGRQINLGEVGIPSSYWVTSVILLSVGCTFALVSTAFSALNIFYSPVEPVWGYCCIYRLDSLYRVFLAYVSKTILPYAFCVHRILGLYVWNSIAAAGAALTMIVWGALFMNRLFDNVAISDTLRENGFTSAGLAQLGYSYW